MTLATLEREWHAEFTPDDLGALRAAIPKAVHLGQERAARAHSAWGDPDGEQDAYGAMARGVQKELRALIAELPTFREQSIERSRRTLTYVGDVLLFPLRVGKTMPRNHRRIRVAYLSEKRRDLLLKAGTRKYDEPDLFDVSGLALEHREQTDQEAGLEDALGTLEKSGGSPTLVVPYYSSSPIGVGMIYWASAKLSGNYLEFADPELLTFVQAPAQSVPTKTALKPATGFGAGERPRTSTRLRPAPKNHTEP